jgi:Flp pilus assembly protein TadG
MRIARHKRTGLAAVEMGIILPMLLILLLGIWEVGRMVEVTQLLTNAAREGGRQASTGAKNADQVKETVVRYLHQNGITKVGPTDVKVVSLPSGADVEPMDAKQLDHFQVKVTIPFDSVRWAFLSQITSLQTLSGSADWYSVRDIPINVDYTIPLQ